MSPQAKPELTQTLEAALAAFTDGYAERARFLLGGVLTEDPVNHNALHLLGLLDCQEGRLEAGIARIHMAIALFPRFPAALNNLAVQLRQTGRLAEAADAYRQALALEPHNASYYANLANTLQDMGQHAEAITEYRRAIELQPDSVKVRISLALLLRHQHDDVAALEQLEAAIQQRPDAPIALLELAMLYRSQGRLDKALDCFRSFLRQDADNGPMRSEFILTLLQTGAWMEAATEQQTLLHDLETGAGTATPFPLLVWQDKPSLHHKAATHFTSVSYPSRPALWRRARYRHRRIRVAYLSADFHDHATAHLMASVFELHDRSVFDIRAVSFGPDQVSPMRTRLIRAFDRFSDTREMTAEAIARDMRAQQIDIAVDLKGHTKDTRLEIFAARPAPVQVSFLGYPGTTGANFIDYILADPFVVPHDQQPFYSEKIVHLPACYQPNDAARPRPLSLSPRTAEALPQQGFVFCCFNNTFKVQPAIFAIWMRILAAVPGSVLWLLGDNRWATENLRHAAAMHGIGSARLIFAPRKPAVDHFSRYPKADLFLDTLPYNAHTTAAEALWMGLPVLTCSGHTFAARVAGSLLHNVGLSELVTSSLGEYEALAIRLATHPAELRVLRDRLALNRATAALFDSQRFTRHLEAAFRQMHEIAQRGEKPRPFDIPALPEAVPFDSQESAGVTGDALPNNIKVDYISESLKSPSSAKEGLNKSQPAEDSRVFSIAGSAERGLIQRRPKSRVIYDACPLCNNTNIRYLRRDNCSQHPLYDPIIEPDMIWMKCEHCLHIFTEGVFSPEVSAVIFGNVHDNQKPGADFERQRFISARIVEKVAQHVRGGAWLDVGFGNGSLLFTAAEWGFSPMGLDLRPSSVEAMRRLGVDAHCIDLIDFEASTTFNVISMADVLEHTQFPRKALVSARHLLSPSGILLLSMPNYDSMAWRLLDATNSNPYWSEIEHYHNFSRDRLYALLEEVGFEPIGYGISERYRICMEIIARNRR